MSFEKNLIGDLKIFLKIILINSTLKIYIYIYKNIKLVFKRMNFKIILLTFDYDKTNFNLEKEEWYFSLNL